MYPLLCIILAAGALSTIAGTLLGVKLGFKLVTEYREGTAGQTLWLTHDGGADE